MFSVPLAANKATANQMKGLEINYNFDTRPGASAEMAQLEDEMAAEIAREASNRDKNKDKGKDDDKENTPEKDPDYIGTEGTVAPIPSRQMQSVR